MRHEGQGHVAGGMAVCDASSDGGGAAGLCGAVAAVSWVFKEGVDAPARDHVRPTEIIE